MCTKKSAKFMVVLTFALVAVQYLFNVKMIARTPQSLGNLLGIYRNNSLMTVQRAVTANVSKPTTPAVKLLEPCPIIPPELKGHVTVNTQIPSWTYLEEANAFVEPGGRFRPRDCVARHRVAIVIPFRDREIHLKLFLQNLHPFLQRQQLDYGIFVVELAPDVKFNRALLMNVGFVEALKQYDYQCFIFHDVDLLPEDDRNLYTCPQQPRHMSVAIDRLQYKLPYTQLFGGVSAISREHFKKINGFSNMYFGWGGEDDDLYRRILFSNLTVIRYSPKVARYKMLVHKKESGNPQRYRLLRDMKKRHLVDGLNSLNYTIIKTELKRLFTWILIRVDEKETLSRFRVHAAPPSLPQKKPPPPPPIVPKAPFADNNKPGDQATNAIPRPPVQEQTRNVGPLVQEQAGNVGSALLGQQGNSSPPVQGKSGNAGNSVQGQPGNVIYSVQGQPGNVIYAVQGQPGNAGYSVQVQPDNAGLSVQGQPGNVGISVQGQPGNVVNSVQGQSENAGQTVQGQPGNVGNSVQRQPGNAGQTVQGQPASVEQKSAPAPAKRKASNQVIDWIPSDFHGKLPDYLTNYDFAEKQQKLFAPKPKPIINRPRPIVNKPRPFVNRLPA